MKSEPKYPVHTLIKGLNLYEIISNSEVALSLTEINEISNYGLSTNHRILDTLVAAGFIHKGETDHRYSLGLKSLIIGNRARRKYSQNDEVYDVMKKLSVETGETVKLASINNGNIVYLGVVESNNRLREVQHVGDTGPIHCTAMGKLLLAFLPPDEQNNILQKILPLKVYTDNTECSLVSLLDKLIEIRQLGFAIDNEEYLIGLVGIAYPVWNIFGKIQAAISVSGPTSRFSTEVAINILPRLKQASKLLSNVSLK